MQVCCASATSSWAYVPHPPLLHPVGWGDNQSHDSELLGDTLIPPPFDFLCNLNEGMSDSAPICVTLKGITSMGCLPTSYRTFLSDGSDRSCCPPPQNHKRLMWELSMMILNYNYNETFIRQKEPMPLKDCPQEYRDNDKLWVSLLSGDSPRWLK